MKRFLRLMETLAITPDNYRLFRTVFHDKQRRPLKPTRLSALRAAWACGTYRPSPFGIFPYSPYLKFPKTED